MNNPNIMNNPQNQTPQQPQKPSWVDKIVDYAVGETEVVPFFLFSSQNLILYQ